MEPLLDKPRRPSGDGWRIVAYLNWFLVLAATAAVAVSSRTIGRPAWWLGTAADPAPVVFTAVPVALVVVPVVAVARRMRGAGAIGVACSLGLLASGLADLGDTSAVSTGFVVVSIAALLGNVAVWAGLRQYR